MKRRRSTVALDRAHAVRLLRYLRLRAQILTREVRAENNDSYRLGIAFGYAEAARLIVQTLHRQQRHEADRVAVRGTRWPRVRRHAS